MAVKFPIKLSKCLRSTSFQISNLESLTESWSSRTEDGWITTSELTLPLSEVGALGLRIKCVGSHDQSSEQTSDHLDLFLEVPPPHLGVHGPQSVRSEAAASFRCAASEPPRTDMVPVLSWRVTSPQTGRILLQTPPEARSEISISLSPSEFGAGGAGDELSVECQGHWRGFSVDSVSVQHRVRVLTPPSRPSILGLPEAPLSRYDGSQLPVLTCATAGGAAGNPPARLRWTLDGRDGLGWVGWQTRQTDRGAIKQVSEGLHS